MEDHGRPATWSYESFFARITATANFFHSLGVGKDDVVAFVLPNLPETHLTIWGGEAAGIAFAINPLLGPAAIGELLRAAEAKVLVTLASLAGPHVQVPSLRQVVFVGPEFAEAIARQPTDRLVSGRAIQPDDLSSFFAPAARPARRRSPCARTQTRWPMPGAWVRCSERPSRARRSSAGRRPRERGAGHGPVALLARRARAPRHGAGLPGQGCRARFWELVERHRINFFSGVPTLYAGLLQQPIEGRDIGSLEYGLCGAAPMPVELMRNFQERTGLKILEGYGLTEGTCVSTCNPPLGERRLGSIGIRLPLQPMGSGAGPGGPLRARLRRWRSGRARDPRAERVRGLQGGRAQQGALARCRRRRAGQHHATSDGATPKATSTSRAEKRSSSSAAATTSIRRASRSRCTNPAADGRRGRQARCACRRGGRGLCPAKPGASHRSGADVVRRGTRRRARRAAEEDPHHPGDAAHRGREDLQARAQESRDRGLVAEALRDAGVEIGR